MNIRFSFLFVRFPLFIFLLSLVFHSSEQDNLNKRVDLAKDQPDVDHLDVRGGGQALHLADEDGGHHQHSGQVHAQRCLEEEGFEEGGSKGDHHEKDRRQIGRHHLTCNLPLELDLHGDSFSTVDCVDKVMFFDVEEVHIRLLFHD